MLADLRGIHNTAIAAGKRLKLGKDLDGVAEDLSFIAGSLDQLTSETRAIMEGAKPIDWQQTSLAQALAWLVDGFRRNNQGLVVSFDPAGYDEADAPTVKEALYWIARTALGNVQDHAQARSVQLRLSSTSSTTTMEIADDGVGFDTATAALRDQDQRRHLGLANMQLRAVEIGGNLGIESRPGQGTRIVVQAPRLREAT